MTRAHVRAQRDSARPPPLRVFPAMPYLASGADRGCPSSSNVNGSPGAEIRRYLPVTT